MTTTSKAIFQVSYAPMCHLIPALKHIGWFHGKFLIFRWPLILFIISHSDTILEYNRYAYQHHHKKRRNCLSKFRHIKEKYKKFRQTIFSSNPLNGIESSLWRLEGRKTVIALAMWKSCVAMIFLYVSSSEMKFLTFGPMTFDNETVKRRSMLGVRCYSSI